MEINTTDMEFKNYCEIENLYRDTEILDQEMVIATEKIHGTNVRIGFIDGELIIGGRNQIISKFSTEQEWLDFHEKPKHDAYGFSLWLRCNHPNLFQETEILRNTVVFGEFFGKGIQKGVDYGPDKYLRLFDGYDTKDERWLSGREFDCILGILRYEFKESPCLFYGKPDLTTFKDIYCMDSIVAKQNGVEKTPNILEGIVIKPDLPVQNKHGGRLIIKLKNDKFTEVAKAPKVVSDEDVLQQAEIKDFVNTFVTPARIEHAIQRMFEEGGMVVDEMKHTPDVIQSVWLDLQKECSEDLEKLPEKETRKMSGHKTVLLLKSHLGLVL